MTLSSSESELTTDAGTVTESDRNSSVTPRRLARILEDGLQFGKYRVIRMIAIGGMSEIYEAEHMALDKRVALKVMRRDLAENAIARQRFISEGVNAARLRHTNVVDVTDVGEVDELPFLVMALLDGEDLGRVYDRQGRIPIPEIIDLLLPVASAVAVGHEKGVVHRDLKPDNIFLHREGCRLIPKVLDFGVSRVMTARRITLNSSVFGTPHYMSREQARGGPTDARTDQYSLGVILYEGVTGRLPRDSANPIELLHAVAYDSFRPPSDYFEIPPGLEAVILRAMAADPADRFESMRELAVALLPYASDAARDYWSLELAESTEPVTQTSLPQISRHPSPTPAALAQSQRNSESSIALTSLEPASALARSQWTSESPVSLAPSRRLTQSSAALTPPQRVTQPRAVRTSAVFAPPERASQTNVRIPVPSRHGDMVVARSLPPPPPPPRARAATPAHIVAQTRAKLEIEAILAQQRKRRINSMFAGAAAGLLLSAGGFGFWIWSHEADEAAAAARREEANYFDVDVQASPRSATIVVDGTTVATGQFIRRFRVDGVEHELRVSAPGWSPSTVTFRDASPPKLVQLSPAPPEAEPSVNSTPASAPAPATTAKLSRTTPRRGPASPARSAAATHSHALPSAAVEGAQAPGVRSEPAPSAKPPIDSDDDPTSEPHVAVVEPARPRVRIVDEFEPKVRVVE